MNQPFYNKQLNQFRLSKLTIAIKKALLLLILLIASITSAKAQCGVFLGYDKTINCGDTYKLNAQPKWLNPSTNNTHHLGIYFTNPIIGYMTGNDGEIIKTTNGGKDWTALNSGTNYNLSTIIFTDTNTGYVVGNNLSGASVILKTTNGGASWVKLTFEIATNLSSIYFYDANNGFVVGTNGVIAKTSNGGETWIQKNSNSVAPLKSIHFPSSNIGYAVGESTLLKTSDGGENWTFLNNRWNDGTYQTLKKMVSSEWSPIATSVFFTDESTGFVVTAGSIIYNTKDGGNSWNEYVANTFIMDLGLNFVYFTDASNGYAGGGHFIYKTTDGGSTWTEQTTSYPSGNIQACSFTNPSTYYIAGYGILTTTTAPFNKVTWSPSIGLSATDISNPTANPAQTTKYTVTTETNGCIATQSITINVDPLTASAGYNSATCGNTTHLDITTNCTSTDITYAWSPATGLSAPNIKNPTAVLNNTTIYNVDVKTANGCTAKTTATVNVNPLYTYINPLTISCGGVASIGVLTNYTYEDSLIYKWTPATGLSNPNIKNPEVSINSTTKYSLETKTKTGCVANGSIDVMTTKTDLIPAICLVTVNESDKNVVVWQLMEKSAAQWLYVYRESSFQTDYYDLIGKVPYTATGTFVDVNSNAQTQSNKYKIGVQDVCGYFTDKSSDHKTAHLTINKGIGNSWNLIWEQYSGKAVANYKILRGTDITNLVEIGSTSGSNATYTDLTAPAGQIFYVIEVNFTDACTTLKSIQNTSSRSNIMSTTTVSIDKNGIEQTQYFIYPNPAKDILNIEGLDDLTSSVIISDLQGKEVFNQQIKSSQIDISTLQNGIYIVKIINSRGVQIDKFIKE